MCDRENSYLICKTRRSVSLRSMSSLTERCMAWLPVYTRHSMCVYVQFVCERVKCKMLIMLFEFSFSYNVNEYEGNATRKPTLISNKLTEYGQNHLNRTDKMQKRKKNENCFTRLIYAYMKSKC